MPKVTHKTAQLFIITLLSLVLTACAACNGGKSGPGVAKSEAAATVNGKEISLSEVDSIISLQTQGRQGEMTPLQMGGARLQVLSKLIEEEVLFQRAEKEKFLPTDDELNRAVEEAKKGQTQEAFDKALKDQSLTVESFRDKIKRQLAINKLQEKYTSGIEIKDKEVEDAYNANKESFVKKRGAELAMIVVDPKENGGQDDAKSEAEAQIKIKDIATQLQQGADFADIARRRSEDASNAQGGDMGFIDEAQMQQQFSPQFAAAVMGKKAGDLLGPFATGGRAYIFKVKQIQLQNENLTLASPGVREQATEALRGQRKQLILAALTEVATNDTKIVNYVADKMVSSPNTLGGSRFAEGQPTPGASPSASKSCTATPGPMARILIWLCAMASITPTWRSITAGQQPTMAFWPIAGVIARCCTCTPALAHTARAWCS